MQEETPAEYERALWKMLAFCGRYGHQPMSEVMTLSRVDLVNFAAAVGELVKEEHSRET